MPVLPLVESSRILPDVNLPLARACSTMLAAARSLTEPPGLSHSALPRISTPGRSLAMRARRSNGVLPMRSTVCWPKVGFPEEPFPSASIAEPETSAMFGDQGCIKLKLEDRDLRNVLHRQNETRTTIG